MMNHLSSFVSWAHGLLAERWSFVNISIITCLSLDTDNSQTARDDTYNKTTVDASLKIDFELRNFQRLHKTRLNEKVDFTGEEIYHQSERTFVYQLAFLTKRSETLIS